MGTLLSLRDIPILESKSHVGIAKQIFYSHLTTTTSTTTPFVLPDNILGLSIATIRPGQHISPHIHPTMMELFYVYEGEVDITMYDSSFTNQNNNNNSIITTSTSSSSSSSSIRNDTTTTTTTITCSYGCLYVAEPNVTHSFTVRSDAPMDAKLMVLQIAMDDDNNDNDNNDATTT
jgi:oxalate decarboxylase/phosphoglucose isomerase-like protein (cupin superfamily)